MQESAFVLRAGHTLDVRDAPVDGDGGLNALRAWAASEQVAKVSRERR